MRIVSGKFRAKKLCPPSHDIRPTLDKVKQALFTKLQFQIEGAAVLDLFSGSGALGIEAISRGARKVVFVDSNTKSIDLTKKNVSSLKLDGACKIEIKKSDFLTYLESAKEKFDIIILDPPYEKGFYNPALEAIFKNNLLTEEGVIVCEHLRTHPLSQDFFEVMDIKNYGTVTLTYLTRK